ncbi:hypothetical protein [Paenibacillus sp. yr247]|uniref:hypothetical protein n=1 Tax=Paenibacillus sp. yr247 TaxID=1761880 RepID=UPI0011406434|nr:hypothetical protein [Paenibacillus sp. yr247]
MKFAKEAIEYASNNRSRCWDGDQRKSLFQTEKVMVIEQGKGITESQKGLKSVLGHIIPFGLLATSLTSFGSFASAQGMNEPAMAAMVVPDHVKERIQNTANGKEIKRFIDEYRNHVVNFR